MAKKSKKTAAKATPRRSARAAKTAATKRPPDALTDGHTARIADALEAIAAQLSANAPAANSADSLNSADAFVWHPDGRLSPVPRVSRVEIGLLKGIDRMRDILIENTERFANGLPANNALLWGARGMGKSSLVKAAHASINVDRKPADRLKLIEIHREDIESLPALMDLLRDSAFRFIVFCDDLSFEADEPGYKALKAILDGTIAATTENVLVYATSNRRHLMPEYMHENLETKYVDEEVHPGETVEEKISLSERFGLWVSFYPFDQEHYLDIARYWVGVLGVTDPDQEELRREALQWALSRGSRSGRVAWHFARDYAGRRLLEARRGRKAGR